MNKLSRLVLLAYGNPSRGDDAAATDLLSRLKSRAHASKIRQLDYIEDIQLNPEHALDLENAEGVIFIDAAKVPQPLQNPTSPGFVFEKITAKKSTQFTSHIQSPENILYLLQLTHPAALPRAYFLRLAGKQFVLGEPMSSLTRQAIDQAVKFVETLLRQPLHRWPEKWPPAGPVASSQACREEEPPAAHRHTVNTVG